MPAAAKTCFGKYYDIGHNDHSRAVLIPVTDLNPDSDFHDFFASIPIPIQFRVRSDSNLEPTPQVDLIPYTYIRTHCR